MKNESDIRRNSNSDRERNRGRDREQNREHIKEDFLTGTAVASSFPFPTHEIPEKETLRAEPKDKNDLEKKKRMA